MITPDKINEVVERIVVNVKPEKIFLFGSYVNGSPTEDSDLDLLVIKEMDIAIHKRNSEVKQYLRGIKIPLDIFVYTPLEIEQYKKSEFGFVSHILKEGKLIYG